MRCNFPDFIANADHDDRAQDIAEHQEATAAEVVAQ
jgi:hypothetical protein